jgi:hypothetical protein
MKRYFGLFLAISIMSFIQLYSPVFAYSEKLNVPARFQQTEQWCWLAVSEMIFRHFGVPTVNHGKDYQCGIAAVALGGICNWDCYKCPAPAGSADKITETLERYPSIAASLPNASRVELHAEHVDEALSPEQTVADINDENPIIAGISPLGVVAGQSGSAHVALIIGYSKNGDGLTVNDPYPFDYLHLKNPYRSAGATVEDHGRYKINRSDFIEKLNWKESWRVAKDDIPKDLVEEPDTKSYCDAIGKFVNDSINYVSRLKQTKIYQRGSVGVWFSKIGIDDTKCLVKRDSDNSSSTLTCEASYETDDDAQDDFVTFVREADRCIAKLDDATKAQFNREPLIVEGEQEDTATLSEVYYIRSIGAEMKNTITTHVGGKKVSLELAVYK